MALKELKFEMTCTDCGKVRSVTYARMRIIVTKGKNICLPCHGKRFSGENSVMKRPEVRRKIGEANKGRPSPSTRLRNLTNNPSKPGELSPHWKGDKVGYRTLHKWVEKVKGIPTTCSECGIVPERKIRRPVQWANLSGKYLRDENDWAAMCISCHLRRDWKIIKLNRIQNVKTR